MSLLTTSCKYAGFGGNRFAQVSPAVIHPVFISLAIFRRSQESADLRVCRDTQTTQDKQVHFTFTWISYYFLSFKTRSGLWRRLHSINWAWPLIRQEMPCSLPYKCFARQNWINQDHYAQEWLASPVFGYVMFWQLWLWNTDTLTLQQVRDEPNMAIV